MSRFITVFTPTYNRKELLKNAYESLISQSERDFEWVIMDDGSEDGTSKMVKEWSDKSDISIIYHYQKNQGRFAAFNHAKKYFGGELVVLLDSDNMFLPGALFELKKVWKNLGTEAKKYSGIISYMESEGNIVGSKFPHKIKAERIYVLYDKYKLKGDKALAFRNDVLQQYRYPIYKGERFGGDAILFNKINDQLPMYILRKCTIDRGFPEDSITNDLLRHHLASPNGMREHYKDTLEHECVNQWNILKHCIGYVAFSKLTGRRINEIIRKSPKAIRTFCYYPFGLILYYKLKKAA